MYIKQPRFCMFLFYEKSEIRLKCILKTDKSFTVVRCVLWATRFSSELNSRWTLHPHKQYTIVNLPERHETLWVPTQKNGGSWERPTFRVHLNGFFLLGDRKRPVRVPILALLTDHRQLLYSPYRILWFFCVKTEPSTNRHNKPALRIWWQESISIASVIQYHYTGRGNDSPLMFLSQG